MRSDTSGKQVEQHETSFPLVELLGASDPTTSVGTLQMDED